MTLLRDIDQKGLGTVVEEAMSEKWREAVGDTFEASGMESAEKAWEAGGHVYDIHSDAFEVIDGMMSGELSGEEGWEVLEKKMKKKTVEMLESVVPEPIKDALSTAREAQQWTEDLVDDAKWAQEKVTSAVAGSERVYQEYFGENATEAFEPGSVEREVLESESSISTEGYLPAEVVNSFVDPESPQDYEAFVEVDESYQSPDTFESFEIEEPIEEQYVARSGDAVTEPTRDENDARESSLSPAADSAGSAEPDLQSEIDGILDETLDRNAQMRESNKSGASNESRQRLASATASSSGAGWSNAITSVVTGTAIASDTYSRGGAPSPLLNTLPGRQTHDTAGMSGDRGPAGASQCASLTPEYDASRCEAYKSCARLQVEELIPWERDNAEALRMLDAKSRSDLIRSYRLSLDASREIASSSCAAMPAVFARHERIARDEAARLGMDYDELRRSMGAR